VVVDAIDESLISETALFRGRPTPSIAHVLENGLVLANGLPTWIKFVISCRKEMFTATRPQVLRGKDVDVTWENQLASSEWTGIDESIRPDLD